MRNEMSFRTAVSDQNHRYTRWSKFCFWVGSHIRVKQLLSTYVQLSVYASLQRHKVGTYLLQKRNFESGNCISSSYVLWYFLHHCSVCTIPSQACQSAASMLFGGMLCITDRITWYKNIEITPATYITSLSHHHIIHWPHYTAQKNTASVL